MSTTNPALAFVLALATGLAGPAAWSGSDARERAQVDAVRPMPDEVSITTSDDASIDEQDYSRSPDGLFYVRARVNGRSVRFVVDTGASVMVLTAADAALVGVTPPPSRFKANVETAGGNAAMAWARLDQVQIAGREVRGVRAAVTRGGLGVSLLGQNMLSKMASVSIEGDRLRLR